MKINNRTKLDNIFIKFKFKSQSTEKLYFISYCFSKNKQFLMVMFMKFWRLFTVKLDFIYQFKSPLLFTNMILLQSFAYLKLLMCCHLDLGIGNPHQ